jgi:serine/threonine protein kinase/tetratricopeptide (TPR) repeat protein
MNSFQSNRVRLGRFEFDLTSGELRSLEGDRATILQEQPFQVLRILIERNGGVVTRHEIRNKLWPNDTAVDFNHSINVAIGTLRRVLGDSAEEPQYIETVARRGYRLIAVTEWMVESHSSTKADGRREPETSPLIGRKVSHYRVLEVIGGGGMGMVYKAEDLKLGRRVALKFLPEEVAGDPSALRRFEREARTASSLNHANICTIFEIEEYAGQPFIAMELLEGETLRDRLAASGAIPLAALLAIAVQVCEGLEAAHGKGIIHRDIKPANIFLTKQGPVKILDFGLAKLAAPEDQEEMVEERNHASPRARISSAIREIDASLTRTGMAIGTAGYMSPEQIQKGALDARTDLFSFGMVLYEMATGQRAFAGETVEVMHDAILTQTPASAHEVNAAVPARLETIIDRGLEKDRSQRYATAAAMREDLQSLQSGKRPPVRGLWKLLLATALLLAFVAGGWFYWRARKSARLSANDSVVLADISNRTSDPVFDDALNTALRVEFEQTPFLNVLAADKVRGTLKLLNLAEDAKITPQTARAVCLRTNSRATIASSIADEGNHFRIDLAGIDCKTGKTLARTGQDIVSRNEIVHALGVSGSQLRSKLGEPDPSVKNFSKPLDVATSSSLEALQLLTQGYRHHIARDDLAVSYYQQAIGMDPNLALAYVALGARYANLEQRELAAAAETRAYNLRSRLTGQAEFLAESLYHELVTGDTEKAYLVYSQWVQSFPLDVLAHINFTICLQILGQPQRAVSEAREAVRLLPGAATYANLIQSALLASRIDEAQAVLDEAQARGIEGPVFRDNRHEIAFLRHDTQGMKEQLDWAMGKSDAQDLLVSSQADVEVYYGRFRKARRLLGTTHMESFALQEADAGNVAIARRVFDAAKVPDLRQRSTLAVLLARTGRIEQAQSLSDSVSRAFPSDTMVQYFYLPAIHAAIKLQQNDPAAAVEILQPALKYDLSLPRDFWVLYPVYLRGLAYLQMNDGPKAAQEFQKIRHNPGLIERSVIGSFSLVQLARAQAMAGDRAAAHKSYQDFLNLWKDADPDIPIYQQAKAEYAKLG